MSNDKVAKTSRPIEPVIAARWSPLAFDPERPVERDKLLQVVEAGRWALSCFNEQPWRYLICDRFTNEDSWNKALNCLVPGNQRWARTAPILIAAMSIGRFARNNKENRWANYDTGAASISLCLQATASGMAMHQMGGFSADQVRESFGVPDDVDVIAMMALGYHGDLGVLGEKERERQNADRRRKAVSEIAFYNEWEAGLSTD